MQDISIGIGDFRFFCMVSEFADGSLTAFYCGSGGRKRRRFVGKHLSNSGKGTGSKPIRERRSDPNQQKLGMPAVRSWWWCSLCTCRSLHTTGGFTIVNRVRVLEFFIYLN
jgi:hypothetical protein